MRGGVWSDLSGAARDVVQAGHVHGGVHFHSPAPVSAEVPVPRQLPGDVSGFVGRAAELAQLDELLPEDGGGPEGVVSVVVIAGTAGVGKTSLAVHLAHRISGRFPHGQLFVNLRGYDTGPPLAPAAVLERFLRALGVPGPAVPSGLEERAELYRSLLADKRVLVVLDNAATVGQVRPLLPGTTGCLTLVTSRHRLSGLAVRDGARRITLGMLSEQESAELITAATRGYRTGDDPGQIAELAQLCARLPLALRIAAERAATHPLFALPELAAQLRDESTLWEALSSPDEEEADAVRTVFAWSYRTLPPPAARLFRLLGLHPGPDISVHAAAALTEQEPRQTHSLLDLLAGAHLIESIGADRYQFHDLLRAYATDQAHQEETLEGQHAAFHRLASWYLYTADAACAAAQTFDPSILPSEQTGPAPVMAFGGQQEAFAWHQSEQANLLAVARTAAQAGLEEIAWQLPAALHGIHMARSVFDDWKAMADIGLEAARRLGDQRAQALMHNTLGIANKDSGQLVRATEHHQAALDLRTRIDDHAGMAESANGLALVHLGRRELDASRTRLEQALALYQQYGPHHWTGVVLCNLGFTAADLGELHQAAHFTRQALTVYRETGADHSLRIDALRLLARLARETGQYAQAEEHLADAFSLQEHSSFVTIDAALRLEQATLLNAQNRHEQAVEAYWVCERLQRSIGNRTGQALAYDGIGQTLRALGRLTEAIDFHTTAARILRDQNQPWGLANALAHLADVCTADEQSEHACQHRAEALVLLDGFTDPPAAALRQRLQELTTG
ncbi:ATP-binding protein [Streptomyces rapamycinicus]|uniref:ATP-binding protein n=1 Tax=Streptomyces rapamycinicus TaxID=1226757 RepID=UPI000429E2CD|nr:tetratricopeptide repeat protein [Streptomyces rapamycinicus]UTP34187.1 tetratricopeptide repeat protein [Streptomyces rapamycinicus NRRL 5491]